MILRELAIYLWGDWGKGGPCLLSSRCVCTLIERLLDKKVRTEESWKASLLWARSIYMKQMYINKFKTQLWRNIMKQNLQSHLAYAGYDGPGPGGFAMQIFEMSRSF